MSKKPVSVGHNTGHPHTPLWTIMQRADDPDIKRANQQLKDDITYGANGIALVFEGAHNAFGYGLPAKKDTIARLFDGIALDGLHIRLDNHPHGRALTDTVIDYLQKSRLDPHKTSITFSTDPTATLATTGRLKMSIAALKASLPQSMSAFFSSGLPGIVLEADGRPYHNAGATAAQEIGAMLSVACSHLRMVEEGRHHIAYALPHIGFATALDQNLVLGLAKLQALQMLWRRLQEKNGITNPLPAVIHVETSMRMMTQRDVLTNIPRTTAATIAAITGGAASLSVLPYSIALGLPDTDARRQARNTQLVFAREVKTPLDGSYAPPASMADDIAAAAWQEYQRFEKEGGVLNSLIDGSLARRFMEAQDLRITSYLKGERTILGTTQYRQKKQAPVGIYKNSSSDFIAEGIEHCTPLEGKRLDVSVEEATKHAPVETIDGVR